MKIRLLVLLSTVLALPAALPAADNTDGGAKLPEGLRVNYSATLQGRVSAPTTTDTTAAEAENAETFKTAPEQGTNSTPQK